MSAFNSLTPPPQLPTVRGGPNPVMMETGFAAQTPTIGLQGAEQALLGGGQAATQSLLEGVGRARGDILAGRAGAAEQLGVGQSLIGQATQQGVNQLGGAQQQLRRDIGQAQNILGGGQQALQGGAGQAQDILNQRFGQAVDPLAGFQQTGAQANQLQAALTGALGPEAQRQAISNFQNDPGQQFIREEQERALLRNAAAIGGLGGGNVRRELQRQAAARAQTDFANRVAQLANLSGQGLQAAGQIGQLRGTQGQVGAGIAQGLGRDIADVRGQQAGLQTQAGLSGLQTAGNIANVLTGGAGQQAQLAQNVAQIEQATGLNLAQLADQTGRSVADIVTDIGRTSAGLRTQAGRDLAQAIQQTTGGVSALQAQQGAGISDILGQGGSQLTNLLLQQGLLDADAQRQLGTLLANIGVEGATNQAALAQNVGNIQAAGVLGKNQVVADAITALGAELGRSDILDGIFNRAPVQGARVGSR